MANSKATGYDNLAVTTDLVNESDAKAADKPAAISSVANANYSLAQPKNYPYIPCAAGEFPENPPPPYEAVAPAAWGPPYTSTVSETWSTPYAPTGPEAWSAQGNVVVEREVIYGSLPRRSFLAHICFAFLVFCFFNWILGIIALLLAARARRVELNGQPDKANTLGIASIGVSVAGIVTGIILIILYVVLRSQH